MHQNPARQRRGTVPFSRAAPLARRVLSPLRDSRHAAGYRIVGGAWGVVRLVPLRAGEGMTAVARLRCSRNRDAGAGMGPHELRVDATPGRICRRRARSAYCWTPERHSFVAVPGAAG